ncbi:cobalt-zinc-cadmium efflux system outer membrane protein [Extensimonas vulgaris]|uniref:Cobalt-zinc-cadmium efflux system outer membrane protein n=2 Tax=Extensimonas vulgaris TaxID=1031594 RepID=A0A369AN18_9BURK|nr:cobalt-zinc-cadmium efflux system outer membrane protein [Extensimonas vulgaris]TWI39306.1 cobalt-zinc-cadmium efflux system outer membrane protein [Extensimonas vulgaris]TXD15682.1 TolC family protein [Extensimonas vulgaris]
MLAPALAEPAAMAQAAGARALTLAQVLAAARDSSAVLQARAALSAAQADIKSADHAPLPVFTGKSSSMDLQHGLGSGSLLGQKRIDKSLELDWTWERGNKRALRTEAAQRSADAAQSDVHEVQTQQLQAALAAYFELLAAQERLHETQAIEHSAQELARLAERRLQAGDLAAQDVQRTRIEAERAHTDTQAATLAYEQAAVALVQIIGRNAGLGAGAALSASASDWPAAPATADTALPPALRADLDALVEDRSDVRAALSRLRAAQAALALANAQRKSDWTLGASYDHWPGTSNRLVELRIQMPLQWGYHYEGEIGRAQAMEEQAQELLDDTRRQARLDLQNLQQTALRAAQRVASFERGILPRAREVAQSAEFAYAKGALPLTDLLDARRTLRATLLDAVTARADYAKALGAWQLRVQPQALLGPQP